jgi:hypothetical protein
MTFVTDDVRRRIADLRDRLLQDGDVDAQEIVDLHDRYGDVLSPIAMRWPMMVVAERGTRSPCSSATSCAAAGRRSTHCCASRALVLH